MRLRKSALAAVVSLIMIMQSMYVVFAANLTAKAAFTDKTQSYSSVTYDDYISQAPDNNRPDVKIEIDAVKYNSATADIRVVSEADEISGETSQGLYCGDTGTVDWSFYAEHAGLYELSVLYYNNEDGGNDIERSLYLDGQIPYSDAGNLVFTRTWRDCGEKIYNNSSDNENRRTQEEVHVWSKVSLRATTGYHDSNLMFYLTEGAHTLTLKSVNESIVLGRFIFSNSPDVKSYSEIKNTYNEQGYTAVSPGTSLKVQGEDAAYKSSSTLYAVEDRTSPYNEPYDVGKIRLNCIGGTTWKYQGAWIEWEIDVPDTGLYQICIRAKQNYSSGIVYTKTLTVDGEVPFEEARNIGFKYSSNWQIVTPKTADGETCLFYLEKGTHKLRLTNTLSELGDLLRNIENSTAVLSTLYRKVCMVVGTSATVDANRDYELEKYIPDLMDIINEQYEAFTDYIERLESLAGAAGEQTVSLQQVQSQLLYYKNNESKIPSKISSLSDCISSLSSWITTVTEQSVLIDYITVISPGDEQPKADCGFWGKLLNELKSYVNSFVSEYSLIENNDVDENGEKVTLWLSNTVGRDQANIVKQLAQTSFTSDTGIALEIELVDMSILLRAVAAGNGPDVGIYIDQATPVNYGIRSALQDLTVFDDLDEVLKRFNEGAAIPFTFNGAFYALPETETFLMMFVRTDIFNDLGIKVPQTWDDLYSVTPTLNRNYYSVSLPSPLTGGENTSTALNKVYAALLLQHGVPVYNDDGSRCVLDNMKAVNLFVTWSEMYTKYGFPKTTDAITYFRIGTAPIVINELSFYNQLIVGAPEIRGMWEMYLLPGTKQSDGTVAHNNPATLTGCVMFANAENKQASWEFLKWWTSNDTQSLYAHEIEALQGKAGRWMTANTAALETIGWSSEDLAKIKEALSWVEGIPEVAGGYYVGRSIDNAIKSVINSGKIPKETLLDYVDDINTEIISKRTELGLEQ